MQQRIVYFDCNATTPLIQEAAEAAISALTERFANPSSVHWEGCLAQRIRETARERASQLLGTKKDEIIFTSGATESVHTAVFSAINHALRLRGSGQKKSKRLILCGETEHKVVPEALRHWNEILGAELSILQIPVDKHGQFDSAFLQEYMRDCFFLCTMAVNNETGAIQDLSIIEKLVQEEQKTSCKPLWLVDGVQALGKIELNLDRGLIDYCAFSGHKVYAPKGTGILFARLDAPYSPLFVGGGQEAGRRSGTEALPALSGLSEVLHFFLEVKKDGAPSKKNPFRAAEELKEFRSRLVKALIGALPGLELTLSESQTVPSTLHFSVKGFSNTEIWVLLEAHGVLVSSGSACQSAKVAPSHVMVALKAEPWKLASATRLSFGLATSASEIEEGCKRIARAGVSLAATYSSTRDIVRISNGHSTAVVFVDPSTAKDMIIGCCPDLDLRLDQWLQKNSQTLKILRHDLLLADNAGQPANRASFKAPEFKGATELKVGPWNLKLYRTAQMYESSSSAASGDQVAALVVESQNPEQLKIAFFADKWALQEHPEVLGVVSRGLGLICSGDLEGAGFPFCIRDGRSLFVHDLSSADDLAIEVSLAELESQSNNDQLVDVRENYEQSELSPFQFAALKLQKQHGEVLAVPVSEICAFVMQQNMEDPRRERKYLFFCRSGKRGNNVAALMKLMGWQDSRSLDGGLSCLASSLENTNF